jgi:hypothetical protein
MGPRMRTKARPRSQGGEPTRGQHLVTGPRTGAEEENAEGPRRRTEARPKVSFGAPRRRRGAKEEHQGEAEEPRTAEAEEVTEQEHHRGRGRDRAGAPPRQRKGSNRSSAETKERDREGAPPRTGAKEWSRPRSGAEEYTTTNNLAFCSDVSDQRPSTNQPTKNEFVNETPDILSSLPVRVVRGPSSKYRLLATTVEGPQIAQSPAQ